MLTSPDFKNLLSLLQREKVKYLIVGGYAVMKYSEPRFTKDLDLLIATDNENAESVFKVLKEFGAPLKDLTAKDFMEEEYFYQMGKPPFRLDIMMSIPGVKFDSAWKNRVEVKLNDITLSFISKTDLIKAKKASGRQQDLIDVENLERTERKT